MSKNPSTMRKTLAVKKYLYEYLSTMGPNTNEPIKIPIGSIDASVPLSISERLYSAESCGNVAPNVIRDIPNRNITIHEAAKTSFLLYFTNN